MVMVKEHYGRMLICIIVTVLGLFWAFHILAFGDANRTILISFGMIALGVYATLGFLIEIIKYNAKQAIAEALQLQQLTIEVELPGQTEI